MRFAIAAIAIGGLLLAPGVIGQTTPSPWPPENHSPNVEAVSWVPRSPARGDDIDVHLELNPQNDAPYEVLLQVCRVENYACRAAIAFEGEPQDLTTTVTWDARFYSGVERIGFQVILRWPNATTEHSPQSSWPERPPDLAAVAGEYYFLSLPSERGTPGIEWVTALGLSMAAAWMHARRRLA